MQLLYSFLGRIMDICVSGVHDYGLAIILFTFVTKVLMLPLTVWTYFNSIKMVQIQPEYNEIKARFWGRQDEMAEEHARLFKREKYHPLASSFPLIAQLILLIGVVGVIRMGIDNPATDMSFGPIDLGIVPCEAGIMYVWSPVIAGLSSWLLCITQNMSNILQAEQSKWNKYGTMIFSVVLSLYLGWFVPIGTALYWVCSNLMSIIQMYIMNWIIRPKRYVDYERLEESRKLLNELESGGKKDRKGFFSVERRKERKDYKRFFAVVNKHIVFYSESNGFYKYYKGFIEWLLSNTKLTIHYITSDFNDDIFEMEKKEPRIRAYYIDEIKLITLMMKMDSDVVVMTMPDLETYHIKRSYVRKDIEYVFVNHGFGSNNLTLRKGATDHFDTVFCAGPHQREEEEKLGVLHNLHERNLINVGYPLIDDIRAKYKKSTHKEYNNKMILIAPSWQKDNIIDLCLESILNELEMTGYKIIVRPHPQEVRQKKSYFEKLKTEYEKRGIEIQTDFTSNNPVLEADLLITDWSDICWEYAFSTLRPVLFIDTPMKIMNPEYKKIDTVPINILLRNKIGRNISVQEIGNIRETAEELLNNGNSYRERIDELAHEYVYNLDNSASKGGEYLRETVKRIIAERKRNNAANE